MPQFRPIGIRATPAAAHRRHRKGIEDMNAAHLAAVIVATLACATDLRRRRIPTLLTFSAPALALAVASWTDGTAGAMTSSAGWIAGLAIFFVPFALRGLGGGDVKLLAALGAWVGPTDVIWVAL